MEQTEKVKEAGKRFVTLCGRIFRDTDSSYFPRAQYHGRTIFLCTDSCLSAFLADPEIFYKVHRNSEKNKGTVTNDKSKSLE